MVSEKSPRLKSRLKKPAVVPQIEEQDGGELASGELSLPINASEDMFRYEKIAEAGTVAGGADEESCSSSSTGDAFSVPDFMKASKRNAGTFAVIKVERDKGNIHFRLRADIDPSWMVQQQRARQAATEAAAEAERKLAQVAEYKRKSRANQLDRKRLRRIAKPATAAKSSEQQVRPAEDPLKHLKSEVKLIRAAPKSTAVKTPHKSATKAAHKISNGNKQLPVKSVQLKSAGSKKISKPQKKSLLSAVFPTRKKKQPAKVVHSPRAKKSPIKRLIKKTTIALLKSPRPPKVVTKSVIKKEPKSQKSLQKNKSAVVKVANTRVNDKRESSKKIDAKLAVKPKATKVEKHAKTIKEKPKIETRKIVNRSEKIEGENKKIPLKTKDQPKKVEKKEKRQIQKTPKIALKDFDSRTVVKEIKQDLKKEEIIQINKEVGPCFSEISSAHSRSSSENLSRARSANISATSSGKASTRSSLSEHDKDYELRKITVVEEIEEVEEFQESPQEPETIVATITEDIALEEESLKSRLSSESNKSSQSLKISESFKTSVGSKSSKASLSTKNSSQGSDLLVAENNSESAMEKSEIKEDSGNEENSKFESAQLTPQMTPQITPQTSENSPSSSTPNKSLYELQLEADRERLVHQLSNEAYSDDSFNTDDAFEELQNLPEDLISTLTDDEFELIKGKVEEKKRMLKHVKLSEGHDESYFTAEESDSEIDITDIDFSEELIQIMKMRKRSSQAQRDSVQTERKESEADRQTEHQDQQKKGLLKRPKVKAEQPVDEEINIFKMCEACGWKVCPAEKYKPEPPKEGEEASPEKEHGECPQCTKDVVKDRPSQADCLNCRGVFGSKTMFKLEFDFKEKRSKAICTICLGPLLIAQKEPRVKRVPPQGLRMDIKRDPVLAEMIAKWSDKFDRHTGDGLPHDLGVLYRTIYQKSYADAPELNVVRVKPPGAEIPPRPKYKCPTTFTLDYQYMGKGDRPQNPRIVCKELNHCS
ncbi:microtubule-associated protein 1B-like [Neocloeon triangulifer]|uniref:microtubule-associated protein 1B-like n=1 Tax=Neocloeon triangulifer TaxID=2078957 RepID=UPI00286F6717|nr:microtubule-associated protein 1B-like [Neocloeon triangulifer]